MNQMKIPLQFTLTLAAAVMLSVVAVANYHEVRNAILHPGYGACGRCKITWDLVEGHSTPYGDAKWFVTAPSTTDPIVTIEGVPNDGEEHEVTVPMGMSCFPLCKGCWLALGTPEARLPYYRQLVDDWKRWDTDKHRAEEKWPGIKAAVMAGK